MTNVTVDFNGQAIEVDISGGRGPGFADLVRSLGQIGGVTIPPDATDAEVFALIFGAFAQIVAAAGYTVISEVRAATTANITLSGAQTIDGVSIVAGNRVLVKNQSSTAANGVYVAAAGSWTRATDYDQTAEVLNGSYVRVMDGLTQAGAWVLVTADPITVGTTAQVWYRFDVDMLAILSRSGGADLVGAVGGGTVQDGIAVAETPVALIALTNSFAVGARLRTADGFLYTVASAGASDHHLTTSGGVKLYADTQDGLDPRSLGAPANGVADDAPFVERAFAITKKVKLSGGKTYVFASVIGIPDQTLYADSQYTLTGPGAKVILDGVAAGDAILTSVLAKASPESTSNLYTAKVVISGINWTQRSQSTLINGDRVYNVRFTNNHCDGLHTLAKSYRNHGGHANGYFQSVFITDNTFSECTWFLHGFKGYNVVFSGNKCEQCISGIRLLDPVQIFSAHNLRVVNNLYEGGGQFLRVGNTIAGVYMLNYLESNIIGDMPTAKCNLDLTYGNTQPFDNRGSWFFAGNSFQNAPAQTADAAFRDIKIDQGVENVSFAGGDWTNSTLTSAPIQSVHGTYNRQGPVTEPFILPRSPQSAGRDHIGSTTVRPLSTFLTGAAFNYMRLQLGAIVTAAEYRPFTMDLSVKLELENAANEVFAVASFDTKLMLSPVGSGMFTAPGRVATWDVKQIVSNLMQQDAALVIDSGTSTVTGQMFPVPANFVSGALSRVSTWIECRVNGFVTPAIVGRSAPTQVRTHISGTINGLSRQAGAANRWLSMIA